MVGDEKVRGQTEKKGHVPNVSARSLLHRALTGMKVSGRSRAKKRYFQQEEKGAVLHGGRRSDDSHIFPRFGTFQM